jgi:hypothetical protein
LTRTIRHILARAVERFVWWPCQRMLEADLRLFDRY